MTHHLFRQAPKRRDWPLIVRGKGARVFDAEGRSIVDGTSGGVCVVNVGHGVAEIPEAMAEQAKKIAFAFAGAVDNPVERELADRLVALTPGDLNRVFFVNTGSEATETAVKLARHYFLETGKPEKHKVIGRLHSYHGSSFGALSYGGRMDRRKAYGPYLWDHPKIEPCYCYRCPFGKTPEACGVPCAEDLDRAIREAGPETVAAFVAEPVVSTPIAGAAPPPDYFARIREICDAHDVMFIADEVVTGFGRTGRMFGLEHWNVAPDFLCIGKGMSGGYAPLAATIVHEKVFEAIAGGSGVAPIGFSYGGNPVSCAAGLAALDYIETHDLVSRAARMGEQFGAALETLRDHPLVGDVRGMGLLRGVEIVADKTGKTPFPRSLRAAETVSAHAMAAGGWTLPGYGAAPEGQGDWLGLAPPFVISEEEIGLLVGAIRTALDRFAEESRAAA
jgi:adenosylmethionine-8-amino-7-oxononanoate aminotransferase